MYAVRLFVFLTLVVSAVVSQAQVFQASPSSKRTVLIYEEDGITTVDQLGRASDGWPEIEHRNQFHEAVKAKEFLRQNFPNRIAGTFSDGNALKSSGTPLWKVTAQWSWAYEIELANWIRAEVDKDFFVRHGVATDCADVAYALRWIFARMHGLPMTSRLASGDWMNQDSMRPAWLKLPTANEWYNDKRFRAALDYLLDFTFTHTLLEDSYPTAIKLGSLLEGGYHLTTHDITGHTRPFTNVIRPGETGLPIQVLQSTTPRKVQPLFGDGYWVGEAPVKGTDGLLRFRWPDGTGNGLIAADQMPNFSEEQYDPAFLLKDELFYVGVFRHLDPSFTLDKIAAELLKSVRNTVQFRNQVVNDGFQFCSANDCTEGSAGYEAWSTPSRDSRFGDMLNQLHTFVNMVPESVRIPLEKEMNAPLIQLDHVDYSMRAISWGWGNKVYSVDPRVPPEERWGLSAAAVDSFLQRKVSQLWQDREAFIAKTSSCPANVCVGGSTAWKDRSSWEFDHKLNQLGTIADSYCPAAPDSECAEFNRRLQLPFPLRRPGMTLQQTFESFVHLNSDPRHTVQVRRDGLGPMPFYVGQFSSIGSNAKFLAAASAFGVRIWDLERGNAKIAPPAGAAWTIPELNSNHAWFEENQDVGFRDLMSGVEKRVSLSFKPTGRAASTKGSALLWDLTNYAFVSAEGKLVREGKYDKIRFMDSDHLLVTVGAQVFLYKLEALDVQAIVTTLVPSDEPIFAFRTDLGWFYIQGLLKLLKYDGTVVDFSNAMYPIIAEADGRSLYVLEVTGYLARMDLDKDGAVVSTTPYPNSEVLYSSRPFVSITDGGKKDYVFLANGKFKSVGLLAGESSLTDLQDDLVMGQTQTEFFVRRLNDPKPIFKAMKSNELKFLSAKPGLVRICTYDSGNIDSYSSGCRIENIFNPTSFSLYTGLAGHESWGSSSFNQPLFLKRGLKATFGSNTTWIDP